MIKNESQPEVADIFRMYGEEYRRNNILSSEQFKAMRLIEMCRTAALGGHIEVCDHCSFEQNSYNSCRNRHCPKCQTLVKEKWLNDRKAELLPCSYFHNVFTLPHELNPLILANKNVMLTILFAAVRETLQAFAKDPQWRLIGQLGFISVLHTWNQKLMDHFHLHCIIPAGALSIDRKKWIATKNKYLFRVESLAKEFKKKFLHKLENAYNKEELCFNGNASIFADTQRYQKLLNTLWDKQWIIYSKHPFGGPEQVLEYLGRYTHRVGISNNRIISIREEKVTFSYRDRADENKVKEVSIKVEEFIRRFLLHILPKGFMKIRYFGFMAHTNKRACIPLLRQLINPDAETPDKLIETVQEMMIRLTGIDISCCSECGKGRMVSTCVLPDRKRRDTSKPLMDTS